MILRYGCTVAGVLHTWEPPAVLLLENFFLFWETRADVRSATELTRQGIAVVSKKS